MGWPVPRQVNALRAGISLSHGARLAHTNVTALRRGAMMLSTEDPRWAG
jgi:hypothetical protein